MLTHWGVYYLPKKSNGSALGVGEVFATAEKAARTIEGLTHWALKQRGVHICGEWFDMAPLHVAGEMEQIVDRAGALPFDFEDLQDYMSLYGPQYEAAKAKYKELERFRDSMTFAKDALAEYRLAQVKALAEDLDLAS